MSKWIITVNDKDDKEMRYLAKTPNEVFIKEWGDGAMEVQDIQALAGQGRYGDETSAYGHARSVVPRARDRCAVLTVRGPQSRKLRELRSDQRQEW